MPHNCLTGFHTWVYFVLTFPYVLNTQPKIAGRRAGSVGEDHGGSIQLASGGLRQLLKRASRSCNNTDSYRSNSSSLEGHGVVAGVILAYIICEPLLGI